MSHARKRARRAAVQAIYQWQVTGQNIGEIDAQFTEEHDPKRTDMDYFRELLRQVATRVDELDEAFSPFLDRPMAEVDPVERAILRLATYEFMHRPDVPYRVVINEAVELAKTFGADQSHRYINGILDKVAAKVRAVEIAARKKGTS